MVVYHYSLNDEGMFCSLNQPHRVTLQCRKNCVGVDRQVILFITSCLLICQYRSVFKDTQKGPSHQPPHAPMILTPSRH